MKLATYDCRGHRALGALTPDGQHLLDLAAAAQGRDGGAFNSMLSLIEAGEESLALARSLLVQGGYSDGALVPLGVVRLLAPLPVPTQIRDASVFPDHIRQAPVGMRRMAARLAGHPEPELVPEPDVPPVYRERPIYYLSNRFSVIGPDEAVRWPRYSKVMDYEIELAAVIGRKGRDISVERAAEHIFGYTIYNDFSARDAQWAEMQGMLGPTKGKSFDTGNAMGPWIVTPDELGDVRTLRVSARVNGDIILESDFSQMLHGFEDIIFYISRDETLYPGEVIGSGTVGNGCGMETGRFLEDGDEIEIEIDRVGTLRNRLFHQRD
jgi:2-keto-4-pentenoate hydratase/2-oxohepta-3-ene-1,7-dioic acid hydratase in catechol pathway